MSRGSVSARGASAAPGDGPSPRLAELRRRLRQTSGRRRKLRGLVELLRIVPADVIGLEDLRIEHLPDDSYAPRIALIAAVDSASGDSEITVAGRANSLSASRSGSARSVPSP